jgi:hypothetical protein
MHYLNKGLLTDFLSVSSYSFNISQYKILPGIMFYYHGINLLMDTHVFLW